MCALSSTRARLREVLKAQRDGDLRQRFAEERFRIVECQETRTKAGMFQRDGFIALAFWIHAERGRRLWLNASMPYAVAGEQKFDFAADDLWGVHMEAEILLVAITAKFLQTDVVVAQAPPLHSPLNVRRIFWSRVSMVVGSEKRKHQNLIWMIDINGRPGDMVADNVNNHFAQQECENGLSFHELLMQTLFCSQHVQCVISRTIGYVDFDRRLKSTSS